jgi:endonuclease YncB( thermonuclease family)
MPSGQTLPSKTIFAGYVRLRDSVREVLLEGQARIEQQKVRTYWEAGRLIGGHILRHKHRADYGAQVIQRLAGDLEISERVLYQALQFARAFPILNGRSPLAWTHYRALARVQDPEERARFLAEAKRNEWGGDELARRIAERNAAVQSQPEGSRSSESDSRGSNRSFRFIPKLGKLHTYRVVDTPQGLFLDLGFSTFAAHPDLKGKRFKDGDILRAEPGVPLSHETGLAARDLYTYSAAVEKIVDGDTLWARIGLGPDVFVRQKLRLRGLDAPEIGTGAGQAAKRFVENQLKAATRVVITTTKPDKYDRYLSDVWAYAGQDEPVNLNKALLQAGWARPIDEIPESKWTDLNMGRF